VILGTGHRCALPANPEITAYACPVCGWLWSRNPIVGKWYRDVPAWMLEATRG
jgi:hypothetical protein